MATKKKSTNTGTKPDATQDPQENSNSAQDNSSNYENDGMVFIGGLWANRDKNGNLYFSGYFGSAKLLIFENKKRTQSNQPHYYMQVVNNKKERQDVSTDDIAGELASKADNDDIPF